MNFLKGWKTVTFNVLMILGAVFATPQIKEIVAPETLVAVVAAMNLALRFVTTSPIFKK